ncbi:MAG: DUF362 domain-containing protein [Candidatus Lokiarchaeota archaeon]|nr:DUF362 domain-containing protein [Candidatus Lokiarchaeota archaeon]MBD3243055.1 DUF362 domain-containing protein [Chitinivibrionales bacterium]
MSVPVYFADLSTTPNVGFPEKISLLLRRAGVDQMWGANDYVALKTHFGEKGNITFVNPVVMKHIVRTCGQYTDRLFLTDTNTLYMLSRGEGIGHYHRAFDHGFCIATMGVPVVIADGLRGTHSEAVPIEGGRHYSSVDVAREIHDADGMVVVAHFKLHDLLGISGVCKHLGMGCVARPAKLKMHSSVNPYIDAEACTRCGKCVTWCKREAIAADKPSGVVSIDENVCTGCGICLTTCPSRAIKIRWNSRDRDLARLQEKIMEHAAGVLSNKRGKTVYLSFLKDVYVNCDCEAHVGSRVVNDIGMLASTDPVAIDAACAELVNQRPGIESEYLRDPLSTDKIRSVYPHIDWRHQLSYAESLGIGTTAYTLERV